MYLCITAFSENSNALKSQLTSEECIKFTANQSFNMTSFPTEGIVPTERVQINNYSLELLMSL